MDIQKKCKLVDAAGPLPKNLNLQKSRFLKADGKDKKAVFLTIDTLAGGKAPAKYVKCPGSDCNACGLCAAGALVWAPLHD